MKKLDKIYLATTNPNKISKLTKIVDPYFRKVITIGNLLDIEESADSFEGNAQLKANYVSMLYNSYAIATEGGVLIPALGNNWNALLTRRFVDNENATDWDRIEALLKIMEPYKKEEERKIVWEEAVAIGYKGHTALSKKVVGDQGQLQTKYNSAHYQPGIWQCTLTCYPQFGYKNYFELDDEERKYSDKSWNEISNIVSGYLKTLI
jgi:inosine/xanthosine triphosphate pyrophosphatase family protein